MRILVARESGGWGDILCTLFAVAGLRNNYPAAEISYFTLSSFVPTLEMSGIVDRAVLLGYTDHDHPRRTRIRRRKMNDPFNPRDYGLVRDYDKIVDCWCPADLYERETGGRGERSRIDSFCQAAGVKCPPVPMLSIPPATQRWASNLYREMAGDKPRVLIQVHSSRVTKNWPARHISKLADLLREKGMEPIGVKITGPNVPGLNCLMGLSHVQVAALAAEADCIVAPDSALFHLAAFVRTPCVALFGPTDPEPYFKHYAGTTTLMQNQHAADEALCSMPCLYFEENGFRPRRVCLEEGYCMDCLTPEPIALAVEAAITARKGACGS